MIELKSELQTFSVTNKKEKKRYRRQLQFERENPDECHCIFFGQNCRGYDGKIVEWKWFEAYPHFNSENKVKYPIKLCTNCGKKYVDAPAMA